MIYRRQIMMIPLETFTQQTCIKSDLVIFSCFDTAPAVEEAVDTVADDVKETTWNCNRSGCIVDEITLIRTCKNQNMDYEVRVSVKSVNIKCNFPFPLFTLLL